MDGKRRRRRRRRGGKKEGDGMEEESCTFSTEGCDLPATRTRTRTIATPTFHSCSIRGEGGGVFDDDDFEDDVLVAVVNAETTNTPSSTKNEADEKVFPKGYCLPYFNIA